jgi:hypothetical protein
VRAAVVPQVASRLRAALAERGVAVQVELPLLQRATVAAARCTPDVDLLLGGWRACCSLPLDTSGPPARSLLGCCCCC